MKKYFSYVDGTPQLFKYAPEDGNGAVDFPINSLIYQTCKDDEEDIMVVESLILSKSYFLFMIQIILI